MNFHCTVYCSEGNILVFDLGRMKIWSDLQLNGLCLKDATQSELEENSFDRFYFSFVGFQILLFSQGKVTLLNVFKLLENFEHIVVYLS